MIKKHPFQADIMACLLVFYQLSVQHLEFLPIGADSATLVYLAETTDRQQYFVKLRTSHFEENAIKLLDFFHESGIQHIIPPLRTQSGKIWAPLREMAVSIFPFIHGKNAAEQPLTLPQWQELGGTLRQIHTLTLPPALQATLRTETFSAHYLSEMKTIAAQLKPITPKGLLQTVHTFLLDQSACLQQMVERAVALREYAIQNPCPHVLCHADLHAWNILQLETGEFFITDWDEVILAPKERDLMFIGSGIGGGASGNTDQQQAFYAGYQPDSLCKELVAYYRYARIIEDIVIYYQQIAAGELEPEELEQSFHYLQSNFTAGSTIEKADQAYAECGG
jgi:spectinomycin phosphotransferase